MITSRLAKVYSIIFVAIFSASCKVESVLTFDIVKEGDFNWHQKEPCVIKYGDFDSMIGYTARIKCRGGFSSKYPKHSFSVEFGKKIKVGNLEKDDDWILNANYIDKTFMRNRICYDIFREMNPHKNIAPECVYASLTINGCYEGLYVMTEEVNASMAGLDKSDSLAMLFKDPPVFFKERIPHPQDTLNYYQQKFPKIESSDKTYFIDQFREFLFYSSDMDFAEQIGGWIDIESVIDWHILLLLSNNSDGILKNFYLYKIDSETPFRFAIWDYDHSFGRDGDNELNMMERELDCSRSILLKRLMQSEETGYQEKLRKRYFRLRRNNILTLKNFKSMIDRNDKLISGEIPKNSARWPVNERWYFDANDYAMELEIMLEYFKLRISKLDEHFGQIAPVRKKRKPIPLLPSAPSPSLSSSWPNGHVVFCSGYYPGL